MQATLRPCSLADLNELQAIARQTYDDTFRAQNTPETMQAYLDSAFNEEKLAAELQTPGSNFYFLEVDGQQAGYLKLNRGEAQSDLREEDSLEIERIYLKSEYQGRGLGKWLLHQALAMARQAGMRSAWLGVWQKNQHAIDFYARMGFRVVGTHEFVMGDDHQTDYIMRLEFAPGERSQAERA